jgi:hypothetical protein
MAPSESVAIHESSDVPPGDVGFGFAVTEDMVGGLFPIPMENADAQSKKDRLSASTAVDVILITFMSLS